ncbi:hypothetical protein X797_004580 [Metarhizium robertsii]|uniref:Uncharacterized protein n=2 Tax=Metarhizium robertsii TaxID=568076 RepID=E9ESR9_METRA|nr:uncharacterized protein MAA_03171 [Metarhizium robertsii ARSEF 23]EFZ01942.1 hypothetical protein MAA_03171 [Metarhizium robertsii ARSEF 23]EXV02448.1 hypothetical protein X797_004580 [Metarhizium robertsii]
MAPRRVATTSSHDYVSLVPLPPPTEEDDDGEDVGQRPPKPKRKKTWQRFGLMSFIILLLGSAILLLVLLILWILWKSSMRAADGGPAETPWVYIFRANRATTLVALCTAGLRTVIGLQSSVATGMLAGIILEKIGAPLLKAPFYSIIRAVSIAPSNLLPAVRSRPKDTLSFLVYTLVVLEVLLTVASQFLSAILTTDFAEGTFADINNSTDVRIFVHERGRLNINNKYWELPPASSWTFAESSESFTKGASFDDTGHTYRAFLPFEEEAHRTKLRKFRGPAHVIDHRVVCATPSLRNLSLNWMNNAISWDLSGQIAMETTLYPMLKEIKPQDYVDFVCALAKPTYTNVTTDTYVTTGESSLCAIDSTNWTILLEDPLVVPVFEQGSGPNAISPDKVGHPKGSRMFMILDIVSAFPIWRIRDHHDYKVVRNDGPWVIAAGEEGMETIRITACMTNLAPKTFTVDIHSAWDNPEPRLTWDYQAKRYNTETARHQLGASLIPESFEKRRVLTLAPRPQWQDFPNKTGIWDSPFYFDKILQYTLSVSHVQYENGTTDPGIILSEGDRMIDNNAYISHIHPFQDTLHDTKSPALALQVLLARITQMVYYEDFLRLDNKSDALVSFSSTALIPRKWTGLIAATALVVIHLTLLVIVTIIYLKCTNESLLGSSWQAISQVISDETLPILEHADRMNDEDIRRWAKGQSLDAGNHQVIRCRSTGRVCLGNKGEKT